MQASDILAFPYATCTMFDLHEPKFAGWGHLVVVGEIHSEYCHTVSVLFMRDQTYINY